MSNPAYSAKVRRVTSAAPQPAQASAAPPAVDPVVEDFEEYEDIEEPYDDFEAAPSAMAGTRMRKVALGAAVVLLLSVFGTAAWLLTSTPPTPPTGPRVVGLNIGNIAPNFSLVDVRTNQPLQLASLRGKPVLINFWGTWCPPCRAEMPEMQKVYNKHKDEMVMIGVSMHGRGDTPEVVKAFVDNAKYSWTFIHDADYSVATQYVVNSVPSSYFIDKDGVIQARHIGAMNSDMMEQYLARTKSQLR